jgi:hypothetical protein
MLGRNSPRVPRPLLLLALLACLRPRNEKVYQAVRQPRFERCTLRQVVNIDSAPAMSGGRKGQDCRAQLRAGRGREIEPAFSGALPGNLSPCSMVPAWKDPLLSRTSTRYLAPVPPPRGPSESTPRRMGRALAMRRQAL